MKTKLTIALTLMASGRAMTLAFIHRAGDGGVGDPPDAWLMPLLGDAFVGIAALVVAGMLWKRPAPTTWLLAIIWSAIAIFDALAALVVEISTPWPEFFMIEAFGRSMFVAAVALHLVIVALLLTDEVRDSMGVGRQVVATT